MRNYMKKNQESVELETIVSHEAVPAFPAFSKKKTLFAILGLLIVLPVVLLLFAKQELKNVSLSDEANVQLASAPIATTAVKRGVITIPSGTVKANPFLPYKELKSKSSMDVPGYSLVEPPEVLNETSEAARVMDTIVSGILYSPLAEAVFTPVITTEFSRLAPTEKSSPYFASR